MRKRGKQFACTATALLLAFQLAVFSAQASNSSGFSVRAVLPDNQNPLTQGYFDLTVEPGQVQDLEIVISNKDHREITVSLDTVTASTNENGIINYTGPGRMDETLQVSFAEISAPTAERITIPAGSSASATVRVQVPDEPFDGLVLGSIQALRELSDEEIANAGMIVNQYSYVIGVRLNCGGALPAVDFALDEVDAQLTNGRASIVADLRNTQPALLKGVAATMQVEAQESGAVLFEKEMHDVDIAPNTIFPMTIIDSDGSGLAPGVYTVRIRLAHEDGSWDLEREFTIGAAAAREINQSAVNQGQVSPAGGIALPLWAVITGSAVLLILIFLLVLYLRSRKPYELPADLSELRP